jgi:hypothetical protein
MQHIMAHKGVDNKCRRSMCVHIDGYGSSSGIMLLNETQRKLVSCEVFLFLILVFLTVVLFTSLALVVAGGV